MLSKNEVLKNISELKSTRDKLKPKYLRNLRLYTYSMNVSLNQIKEGNIIGYWNLMDGNGYTSSINENVIQSCIDALVSQLAAKNTRAFFTTVNGTYAQMQIAKQAQQYFDFLYDEQNVTATITEAFRDACIFGNGYVYVDPISRKIQKALPWQVMTLNAEEAYKNVTRIYYERDWYPTVNLANYKGKESYVKYGVYYDTANHTWAEVIYGEKEQVLVHEYNSPVLPFHNIKYQSSIYGKDTTSVVDILYGIQMKLDDLYSTISEAIRVNPASTFIVPMGSDVKTTMLSNRIGQIITYKPIPDVTNPVTAWKPDFIASQYIDMVNMLKKDAYELVGISELSAKSQKPSGLDSGKALQTINDIESERFEVQFKEVIRAYVEVARKCILTFDPNAEILPADRNRLSIKWQDIVNNYYKMKIQFSALDFLSKEPGTRAEEIDKLVAMGVISKNRVAMFYNMPDSEAAYSYGNNAFNACLAVINQAIVNEDYTIPEYIPLQMLKQEILNTMLSLKSAENMENISDVEKLKRLYAEADKMDSQIQEQANNAAKNADEEVWRTNLARQVQQIEATTIAQVSAQNEAANITNNIGVNNE